MDSYRKTEAMPPVLRQAMAFDKVLTEMPNWIQQGELTVGNIASRPRGSFLFPEYDDTWLKPRLDTISTRPGDCRLLTEEDRVRWKSYMDYWPGKNLAAIADVLTTDEVKRAYYRAEDEVDFLSGRFELDGQDANKMVVAARRMVRMKGDIGDEKNGR
jgi:formate C-acetyltransferase